MVTYKYDVLRTGQNTTETVLTTAMSHHRRLDCLRKLSVDGKVDAEPLYLSNLTVASASHNVVFVATENDSVYAFDVNSGATLWMVSLNGAGETASDPHSCTQVTPQIGVTATPVIDRAAGAHGTLFVVAMTKDSSGTYHQRLHALDVTTGAETTGSPKEVAATYNGTTFAPGQYEEARGTAAGQWHDLRDLHVTLRSRGLRGWVMAYNESTLARTSVLNLGPGAAGTGYAAQGPAIWMAGGGPAADAAGNVYLLTGQWPLRDHSQRQRVSQRR